MLSRCVLFAQVPSAIYRVPNTARLCLEREANFRHHDSMLAVTMARRPHLTTYAGLDRQNCFRCRKRKTNIPLLVQVLLALQKLIVQRNGFKKLPSRTNDEPLAPLLAPSLLFQPVCLHTFDTSSLLANPMLQPTLVTCGSHSCCCLRCRISVSMGQLACEANVPTLEMLRQACQAD